MGRVYKLIERPDTSTTHTTRIELDILGNALDVIDPRGNRLQTRTYDLLGHALFTGAADEGYTPSSSKGETRILPDAAGTPLRSWRSGGLSLRPLHDAVRRPIGLLVDEGAGERLVSLSIFGDALSDLPSTNHALGRPVHIYDTAGRVTLTYDLKGRVTAQTRTLLADITTEADWSGLESEGSLADIATWLSTDASLSTDTADTFAVTTAYDALDRVTEQTAPDSSRTVPTYDAGGRLSQVEVNVRGDSTATEIVSSIATNARGQREQIVYGNHTQTSYAYDPERLWLTNLTTTRSSGSSHGAATLQDLGFTRDAVGNITEITDDAQETVYFGNSQVSPTRTFTYDALYRLVSARGREKDAQTQSTAFYADYAGAMGGIPQSGSGVLRRYTQSYEYDAAGNILEVKHQQGDAGTVLWRRGYAYETDNNQLLSTSLPGDDPDDPTTHSQSYAMNDRGAIVYLPHLKTGVSTNLVRDFRDQLRKAELDNAGNVSWYAYDAAGERVWKVWDKGSVVEERIYLGGYEVWRKRNGSGVLQEERQTLHVMDDQRRVAMIETLTVTGGSAVSTPAPRFRYQLDDQLGSALLEVDDDGGVISYEEYHPYGTTAWWAEDAAIEVSRKRYRYTGKERDEETGLQYHSARYYAPWLGRWDRPDPIGLGDGGNRYRALRNSPALHSDPSGLVPPDGPSTDRAIGVPEEAIRQAHYYPFAGPGVEGANKSPDVPQKRPHSLEPGKVITPPTPVDLVSTAGVTIHGWEATERGWIERGVVEGGGKTSAYYVTEYIFDWDNKKQEWSLSVITGLEIVASDGVIASDAAKETFFKSIEEAERRWESFTGYTATTTMGMVKTSFEINIWVRPTDKSGNHIRPPEESEAVSAWTVTGARRRGAVPDTVDQSRIRSAEMYIFRGGPEGDSSMYRVNLDRHGLVDAIVHELSHWLGFGDGYVGSRAPQSDDPQSITRTGRGSVSEVLPFLAIRIDAFHQHTAPTTTPEAP